MKNNPYVELGFLIFVAWALSSILYGFMAFTLASFDMLSESAEINLNSVTSALAGLIIGYRLRDMILSVSKSKKKKK